MPVVRENLIHSPREEMAELKKAIEGEKAHRKSLRISANPDYYATQVAYLDEQIAVLEEKKALLKDRFENSMKLSEESKERQQKFKVRYLCLKHREKIAKIHELKKALENDGD